MLQSAPEPIFRIKPPQPTMVVKQPSCHTLKKTKKRIRKRSEKKMDRRFPLRAKSESACLDSLPICTQAIGGKFERHDKGTSANRISDGETTDSLTELTKLNAKILKVTNYWFGRSVLIPNTFRITSYLEDDEKNVLEYQDLSKKEVLAQYNSKQSASLDMELLSESHEQSHSRLKDTLHSKKGLVRQKASFK